MNRNTIIEAIRDKKMISFTYEDRPIRKAAPHAIYISSTGKENLDAYQLDGYSKTGHLPDWRNFTLTKIERLVILDETFEIARGYNRYSDKYCNTVYKV